MFRTSFYAALAFSALISTGCAHDKLLRQETQAFVAATQKSNAAGQEFYDRQIRKDHELWASLHQLDRKCTPASLRNSYFRTDLKAGAVGLCLESAPSQGKQPSFDLSRADFAGQYAALKFVESYLGALAKASGDPTLHASKDFAAAAADLNTLLAVLGMKKVQDGRITAVGDLAGLLEDLSKEHKSAKAIRAIVAEKRLRAESAFQEIVDALKRDKSHENATLASANALMDLAGNSTEALGISGAEARRIVIEMHYASIDEQDRVAKCEKSASGEVPEGVRYSEKELCRYPAAGVMQVAQQAHREFLGLIDGRLSKAQKQKLINLQRENFIRVFKLYLSVVAAF